MSRRAARARSIRSRTRAVSWVGGVVVAVAVAVGILVAFLAWIGPLGHGPGGAPPYCPLDVSSDVEAPASGPTHNSSPGSPSSYAAGTVIFTASASGCSPPYQYSYTFGDGNSSSSPNVTHVYPGPGYYAGSLRVSVPTGYSSTSYFCVNATVWPSLSVDTGNPAPPCP